MDLDRPLATHNNARLPERPVNLPEPVVAAPDDSTCEDCDADDHRAGSLICAYTADSCSACGGYHNLLYDCTDETPW